jgi:hypothetical protein
MQSQVAEEGIGADVSQLPEHLARIVRLFAYHCRQIYELQPAIRDQNDANDKSESRRE